MVWGTNDIRGSIWRKWDLHFHTPASYDYKNSGIQPEEIIFNLKKFGISAVAITDHHTMDIKLIKKLQELGGDELTVFPGIELRSELGGSESVHYIGIFPENCDLDDVWDKLKGKLNLTSAEIKKIGDENIYRDFENTAKIIHELGGVISVHAGKKTNGIDNISNAELFKQAIKKDLAKNSIDIFDIGNISGLEDYKQIVIPYLLKELKKNFPLIICSDNHNINEYVIKDNCWIKADTTFFGLKQVMREPEARIFIGDTPKKLEYVEKHKQKYIKSLLIKKKQTSKLDEKWFDNCLINFNHDLIAIIGNKGSGKSALTDVIALLGNTKNFSYFSFLNEKKFTQKRNNKTKAENFEASLVWENNSVFNKRLNECIDNTSIEMVKYIPQNFLELICNEVKTEEESNFDKQLKNVIFTHVRDIDRLGKDTLDELISYKTQEIDETIKIIRDELSKINKEITILEYQNTLEYRTNLLKSLKEKQYELNNTEKLKPKEIKKPDEDRNNIKESKKLLSDINTIRDELKLLSHDITTTKSELKKINKYISIINNINISIKNFDRLYNSFKKEYSSKFKELDLEFDEIIKLNIDKKILDAKYKEVAEMHSKLSAKLSHSDSKGLLYEKSKKEKELKNLQQKLDKPNKLYQECLGSIVKWNVDRSRIIGDSTTINTIEYYKQKIKELDSIPAYLVELRLNRIEKSKEIYKEINELVSIYKILYRPVQNFIDNYTLVKNKFNLNFEVSILNTNFQEQFFNKINHGVSGTFCGKENAEKILLSILDKYNFNDENDTINFLNEIIDCLCKDKKNGTEQLVTEQLKKGNTVESLYDYIFSLEYLKPRYTLKLGDRELSQLSPGERGTLLLIFYLLVDKEDIPLIIDQPEENLDNETVYDILVYCIKEAKNRRQIFIVTHNANLAINCDAEQIIYASLDKSDKYNILYITGAIENPKFNKKAVDVLEGTWPAFKNRDLTYIERAS